MMEWLKDPIRIPQLQQKPRRIPIESSKQSQNDPKGSQVSRHNELRMTD